MDQSGINDGPFEEGGADYFDWQLLIPKMVGSDAFPIVESQPFLFEHMHAVWKRERVHRCLHGIHHFAGEH